MYLNARNRLLVEKRMGASTATCVMTSAREVFSMGVRVGAVSLVMVHNHPSGEAMPSPEDVSFTREVYELGRMMEMPLVDHVIVTGTESFSFMDAGLLKAAKG
jgi:DNA repair protein RadC